jgi:hypothetical protein
MGDMLALSVYVVETRFGCARRGQQLYTQQTNSTEDGEHISKQEKQHNERAQR